MACIILKKEEIKEVLAIDTEPNMDSGHWKANDSISRVEHNVMYYAFDVKKVFAQAKGKPSIPVFLKVEKGGSIATVLALKKINQEVENVNQEVELEYYPYAAAGWPSRYEMVKAIYGPGHVIDYKNGIPVEVPEEEEA